MNHRLMHVAVAALFVALTSAKRDLVVAIYGGGPASATLANAIKDYEHIDLQYFDPAQNLTPTSFRLYGFSPSVHQTLAQISEEAGNALNRAGWYAEDPSQIVIGQDGPDAGKVVLDWAKLPNTTHHPEVTVVDPAAYLMQMLNPIDSKRLHPNKRLISVTQQDVSDYPLKLKFEDGTTVEADVLAGDDGTFGTMRSHVLGATHPATAPVFMNFLSAVAHVDPKEAEKLLGARYGDKTAGRRFEHVGLGSWFLNAYLEGFSTCLGSFYTAEQYDIRQFVRTTTAAEIRARFGNLANSEGIIKLLTSYSGLRLIPEIEHPSAPTYTNARIAMTGSSAHTMTNFQQLGPSQDIEDALILSAVLGLARADAPESIDAALYAYDAVRRPRSQWVSEHGKRLGMLWTGMVPEVGLDVGRLREAFLEWKEKGEEFDAGKHREEAVRVMRRRWESGKPVGQEVLEL
ncbi:hypothetical protein FB567DRAFT_581998 [Paraphoma chrysanthemicola]|uniref:FAD/NAD(P)-binding domain-containing protein n=1 Tax=Paraphoma chrysanthemicola TaxID=798071 RepID=A0A8K0R021_9PLEO|nr:hypothetical protein FB567DRAFT_581998 [Paraphoma chrysanthemicola]